MNATWATIVLAGVGTFAMRASFIAVADRLVTVPPWAQRLLRQIPPAALASLVLPALVIVAPEALVAWTEARLFVTPPSLPRRSTCTSYSGCSPNPRGHQRRTSGTASSVTTSAGPRPRSTGVAAVQLAVAADPSGPDSRTRTASETGCPAAGFTPV